MSVGDWWAGLTEESFSAGPYDTREEAIKDGPEALGLGPGDAFVLGVEEEVRIPTVDVDRMLEDMKDNLADNYAEVVVEDWPNAPEEAIKELEELMNALFKEWHGKHAGFSGFAVGKFESMAVPGDEKAATP